MPQFDRQRLAESNHRIGTIKPAQAMTTPFRPENAVQSDEQTLGNQAMQRFAQSCPLSLPSASICPFGGVCHTCPARVQTKLKISQPGDKYEQEADRVAEEVMRMPDPSISEKSEVTGICSTPHIQRYYPECDEELQRKVEEEEEKEEEEELLQTKKIPGHSSEMDLSGEPYINAIRSGGQPLPDSVRDYFEPRFGYDFSQVRIHTGEQAAEAARSVQAQAYTVGRNIVFRTSQYNPYSAPGRHLLAHELTHVVQQGRKAVLAQTDLMNNQPTETSEAEAETIARQVTPAKVEVDGQQPDRLQRAIAEQPQENIINGARACMVHLHGNEQNALRTAQEMHADFCANFMYLNNTGRCVSVSPTCQADPNRIFSTDTITRTNAFRWPCTCPVRERTQAIRDLNQFRNNVLAPAIGRCQEGSGTGMSGPLPVVAFHNNTMGGFGIRSYLPGGSDAGATETVPARLGGATNPAIPDPSSPDDFLLVTQPQDFQALRGQRNVVLQSSNVASTADDGSLSVALANQRYINIETGGKTINNGVLATNRTMAEDVFRQLGVPRRPCDQNSVQRTPGGRTAPSIPFPQEEQGQEEPTSILERIINWLRRLIREIVRVIDALGRMPPPLPREAPPVNLPSHCQTFNNQANLDTRKSHWTGVIASMPTTDVVSWILGITAPPSAIAQEAMQQKDCLLHAIREAARRPGSRLSLPPGQHTRSARRSYGQQETIWSRKFDFLHPHQGQFGRITDHARQTCGSLIHASETEWNPGEPRHRVCWGVAPLARTTAPAIPVGARALNDSERQFEILQTSSAPGISRHHAGTDFDLFDPNMDPEQWETGGAFADEYSWLRRNASTYGFIQSFTATSTFRRLGYVEERWHWSYYPIAQASLEFARSHQSDIERELLSRWGSSRQFSFIQQHWREYMFNVSAQGRF